MNIQLPIEIELKDIVENAIKPLRDEVQSLKFILENYKKTENNELLTDVQVSKILKIGKSTVWDRHKKDPSFPKPKKIGNATRWRKPEIIEYINK